MSKLSSKKGALILGSGNFGTCLAQHLAHKSIPVTLWGRSKPIVDSINYHHRNSKYLSSVELSQNLQATTDLSEELLRDTRYLILAIPTQSLRLVLQQLVGKLNEDIIVISAVKGLENDRLCFPNQIIREVLGSKIASRTAILAGPSFASEVAEQQPTAVAIACLDQSICLEVQELFHTTFFRVYTNDDPLGLEVAGALKNVIAVAAGAVAGMGLQQNARAALLTRGLAEISRMGARLGAKPITFIGLGGVGDLFLTCTSEKSRNFTVGYRLGQGEKLADVVNTLGSIAEGVSTTKAAFALTKKLNIDMPIVTAVYAVLYESQTLKTVLDGLLNRDMKAEIQFQ